MVSVNIDCSPNINIDFVLEGWQEDVMYTLRLADLVGSFQISMQDIFIQYFKAALQKSSLYLKIWNTNIVIVR